MGTPDPHVIILAQGTQQRLGMAHGYKQLLPLPACGSVAIMARTVRQLLTMGCKAQDITIVAWKGLYREFEKRYCMLGMVPHTEELPAPGNSSLRGISAYLKLRGDHHHGDPTLVLFGDVVYSWACLTAIRELGYSHKPGHGFVGTSNLSASDGELWGVAWNYSHKGAMLTELDDALLRHPPFQDEYQPGQMRRWVMGWKRGDLAEHVAKRIRAGTYVPIDDYTMDVDLPRHISLLPLVSEAAAEDDRQHDIVW